MGESFLDLHKMDEVLFAGLVGELEYDMYEHGEREFKRAVLTAGENIAKARELAAKSVPMGRTYLVFAGTTKTTYHDSHFRQRHCLTLGYIVDESLAVSGPEAWAPAGVSLLVSLDIYKDAYAVMREGKFKSIFSAEAIIARKSLETPPTEVPKTPHDEVEAGWWAFFRHRAILKMPVVNHGVEDHYAIHNDFGFYLLRH